MFRSKKTSPNALLALQLLLAFFSTYSILQDVAEDRPFVVSSKAALVKLFFDDSFSSTKRNVAFLYDSKTLIESIEKTVDRYFHLPETSLNDLELDEGGIEVRVRKMKNVDGEDINLKKYERSGGMSTSYYVDEEELHYRITSTTPSSEWKKNILSLDETNASKRGEFLRSFLSLELNFLARSLHREMDKLVLFDFDVKIVYNLESRGGRVEMSVFVGGNHVGGDRFKSVKAVFEDCFLLSLIVFTQIAVVKSKFNEKKKTDEDAERKLVRFPRISNVISQSLFNRSIAVETSANLVLFVACIASISWQILPQEGFGFGRDFARALSGFACFLIWAALCRHMTGMPPYDVAFRAISRGLPVVLQFAVGSAPLLIGFTTLGVALFAEETEKFKNFENGFLTLFSVMNGDIIFESARDIKRGIIGHAYIIIFVVIFVYTIISTFVSIMQKAFAEIEIEKRHENLSTNQRFVQIEEDHYDDHHHHHHHHHRTTTGENGAQYLKEDSLRRELAAIKASLASLERSI